MSQFFKSGGLSIGVSVSASVFSTHVWLWAASTKNQLTLSSILSTCFVPKLLAPFLQPPASACPEGPGHHDWQLNP